MAGEFEMIGNQSLVHLGRRKPDTGLSGIALSRSCLIEVAVFCMTYCSAMPRHRSPITDYRLSPPLMFRVLSLQFLFQFRVGLPPKS